MENHYKKSGCFKFLYGITLLISGILLPSCVKDDDQKLPSNVIHKIVADKNGIKWIATDENLYTFNGSNWSYYTNNPFEDKINITDLSINPSNNNEIWIAGLKHIGFLNFNATGIIHSGSYEVSTNPLLSDTVYALAIDLLDVKYFGTPQGLSILKNDNWSTFVGRRSEEILSEYKVSSIATAKNGWVYAATEGGGVSRFKYTDAISGATTYDSVYAGIRSNYINTVVIVDDTCQWFGTNNGAAFHTSHNTKIDWTQYSTSEGIICDTVLSIAKDLDGNIWFGTSNGVSRFDGNSFTNFTTANGLANNKVNTISIDIDGSVWFGTDNGISHFKDNNWANHNIH